MSEEEAIDAFVALRYTETDGEPFCPRCKCAVTYRLNVKVKNRRTGEVTGTRRVYKCVECEKQFTPTSGTIFQYRKMEHRDLLYGIAIWINGAKGKAALELCRQVNINVKTAHVIEQKLREVMGTYQHAQQLRGKVEIDAAYYGGYVKPSNFKKHRRDRRKLANQSGRKQAVTVMRERKGRTRAFVLTEKEASERALDVIAPGSILYADETKGLDSLEGLFDLRRINHNGNDVENYGEAAYSKGDVNTNQAESWHSRMKRSQMGVHHRMAGA